MDSLSKGIRRINYCLLLIYSTTNMISNANLEEVISSRIECKRCGHSWFRTKEEESHVCPMCNSPYIEDEETNVIRKN